MRRKAGDVIAVEQNPARCRLIDTSYDIEKRGLASAVRANKPGYRPRFNNQRSIVDSVDATEMLYEIFDFNHKNKQAIQRCNSGSPFTLSCLVCVDCRELAVLNDLLKVGTACLTRANQLNLAGTDIVNLAAISQIFQRLAKLTRMDLCSGERWQHQTPLI